MDSEKEAGVKIVPIEGSREAKVNEGATTSGYGLHPSRGVNPVIVGEGVQGGSRGRSKGTRRMERRMERREYSRLPLDWYPYFFRWVVC